MPGKELYYTQKTIASHCTPKNANKAAKIYCQPTLNRQTQQYNLRSKLHN